MLAAAILLASSVAAAASTADDMAAFYGNTLITVDGGVESHFHYQPDHTFTATVPQFHFDMKGRWSVAPDGDICRVFDPPLPLVPNPDCGPMLVHSLGEHQSFPNGDSQALVPGIQ